MGKLFSTKMDSFLAFLKSSKAFLKSGTLESKAIHITLGNESCDLDSTISSLILAYFISKQNITTTVVPVLNVSQQNFLLRTENCFVLKEAGVALENLVFRDEINFVSLLSKNSVTASLVDHHILSKNDEILSNVVIQIFDHRPVDSSHTWDPNKVNLTIEQVGSCCTLVADEILKTDESILTQPLAYLLYQTIVYDTIALNPKHGKAKPLDIEVGAKLKEKFQIVDDSQELFDKLWAAHNDVSHLTAKQLLYKDMKVVESIYIPGLPMLVEEFLGKTESYEALVEFAKENQISCVLLVGLDASGGTVKRDIAIFSVEPEDQLKKALLAALNSNVDYDFQFEKRNTFFDDSTVLLHVHNIKLSRKQLIPLVKLACKQAKVE